MTTVAKLVIRGAAAMSEKELVRVICWLREQAAHLERGRGRTYAKKYTARFLGKAKA